jgi:protein-tyrosine kinase
MERIGRALEKARAQAQANVDLQESDHILVGTPGVGTVPFDANAEVFALQPDQLTANRIVAWDKTNPRTVAFDRLRTKVLRNMKEQGWRTLAVTSPTLACGTTTVAINLSWSIAHQGSPDVVLVDFDLRHPRIADYLAIQPQVDLSNYLQGRAAPCTCMAKVGDLHLRVLPSLRSHQNAAELLNTLEAESLILRLKADPTPRIMIFDLPPILTTDDALAVIPWVDCVLLVLAENLTTKSEASAALNVLGSANLIATVLNRSHVERPSHVR